jgi:GT2 family glycosyltransferase/GNAT superfamily N-acetyltransferase
MKESHYAAESPSLRGTFDSAAAMFPATFTSSGLIEVFGRHEAADAWIFGGWVTHSASLAEVTTADAKFDRGAITGKTLVCRYPRGDLPAGGCGFLAVIPSAERRLGRVLRFDVHTPDALVSITPADDVQELQGRALVDRAIAIEQACHPGEHLPAVRALVAQSFIGEGYIDFYGYHAPASGWFLCGWVSNDWAASAHESGEIRAQFATETIKAPIVISLYDRPDVRGKGVGFVAFVETANASPGRLKLVAMRCGAAVISTRPAASISSIAPKETAARFQDVIAESDRGPARDRLYELVSRPAFDGRDTSASLGGRLLIEFDEVVSCAPDSIVLFGWMLAPDNAVRSLRLRSDNQNFPIDLDANCLWIDRPDVIESVGRAVGFHDQRCGFIARVPTPSFDGAPLHLEIEMRAGQVAFKTLPPARFEGIAAMKRLLGAFETQYLDVDSIYDNIVGPAIAALNDKRLTARPRVSTTQFGQAPTAARFSVIIPLYGRIDLMEIQLALFATLGLGTDVELIYVLDDPPKSREAQTLAESLYSRFRIPFRLGCLSRNVGFAPANNIGLGLATGQFVCFLNSDVLPTTGDWLDRLAGRLEEDPTLGVVGPLLLFEDGTVQHQGIYFKKLTQFGGWWFPHHTRKGFLPPAGAELVRAAVITGAAMLLRREDAVALGGFDEAFAIGDFEDTDLCFKLRQRGLGAAVDCTVRLHHLERKSQAGSAAPWRTNLTLQNAWIHQRRWSREIALLGAGT